MKKNVFYLIFLFSLSYMTSCAPPIQQTATPVQHADPFYNINDNDYPWIVIPLIKPIDAERQDGRTPWRMSLRYGPWVSIPNSQEEYEYNVEELEKFAVNNDVIMAYSAYVDKDANLYVQKNYYHWFVVIPKKEMAEGFHTEDEFLKYIQTLGIQNPNWQIPDKAYKQFAKTGCLEWIPNCK